MIDIDISLPLTYVFFTLCVCFQVCYLVVVDSQVSQSRLAGRQSSINLLRDLLSQFAKLSEEADVVDSEIEVSRVGEQLNEFNDRLSARRADVEVFQIGL